MLTVDARMTGYNIRNLALERGMTAKDLQNACCLGSSQSVYYWFSGRNMPTIDNLVALSGVFGVGLDDIVIKRVI